MMFHFLAESECLLLFAMFVNHFFYSLEESGHGEG